MMHFALQEAATGQITRVDIQAGATASRRHRKAGQSVRITMSASRSMLYHHVVLAKLLQPRGYLVLGASEAQQPYQTVVVRSHNELPSQQVVPVHACKTHNDKTAPSGWCNTLLGGQAENSVGNRRFLGVLNLGKLGRGVCVQDSNSPSCREGQDWGRPQGLLKNVKGGLLLLLPDERFLPGQVVDGKCQSSITSHKASMVVGKTQKPLHIFSRAGSRPVPDGLHIGISHFHTLGLIWRPMNSTLLWNKEHFFGLYFRSNARKRAGWPSGLQSP